MAQPIPVQKDDEREGPVPSAWRRTLGEIAGALAKGNFSLAGIAFVRPLDGETAEHIRRNIQGYGGTLIPLSDETWDRSICLWLEDYWEVLVDLFTAEEGRSDLVLHLNVFEHGDDFRFKVHLVYVP